MQGSPVHGPPVLHELMLVGQAPGPHEAGLGRPFAWTAGRTLFRWFEAATGVDEATLRERMYFTAVARCFPGKAANKGDRKPDREEIARCRRFLSAEVQIVRPRLILPVGGVAIEQVLGHKGPLRDVVGVMQRVVWHEVEADVICLPHPSGVSTWRHTPPGDVLLARALQLIARHPGFLAATARPGGAVGPGARRGAAGRALGAPG